MMKVDAGYTVGERMVGRGSRERMGGCGELRREEIDREMRKWGGRYTGMRVGGGNRG